MGLPKPTVVCKIPSLHLETSLQCHIYRPEVDRSSTRTVEAAAIIAHPYAPLGGSMNDGVVALVASKLLSSSYTVCLFDFRGAENSGGRTSWSGKPELLDYTSVIIFVLQYLWSFAATDMPAESSLRLKLVIGGYSYGSLIASHLPPGDEIIASYFVQDQSSTVLKICEIAKNLASQTTTPLLGENIAQNISINWNYLLVSPLLPPVTYALTLFSGPTFRGTSNKDFPNLVNWPSLAVYGDSDTFTSKTKLRKWAEDLSITQDSKFRVKEVRGGHFWDNAKARVELQEAIEEWLTSMID